jgi:threonine/homoserine/homoserine lactone efflux protein
MLDAVVSGAITGYAIALPIGAVAAYLVGLAARTSWRIGVPAALGVASVDGIYATIAVFGGGALAGVIRPIEDPMRYLAAALLLVVAVLGVRSGLANYRSPTVAADRNSQLTPLRAYLQLMLITAVNPATVLYFAAIVLGDQELAHAPTAEQLVFAAAVLVASASWQVVVALSGAFVGHVLDGPRGRLSTSLVSSAIITGLAGYTLLG